MNPLTYIKLALLAIILGFGAYAWHAIEQNKILKDQITTLEAGLADEARLRGLLSDKLDAELADRQELARKERKFQELKDENPEVRAWADTPIPESVRNIDVPGPDGLPVDANPNPDPGNGADEANAD